MELKYQLSKPTPLPATHRALVFHSRTTKPTVSNLPVPHPTLGSCVVRVLHSAVLPYTNAVYTGQRANYPLPFPLTGGPSAIGRVAAAGADAATLKPGQLVHVDCVVRARDDGDVRLMVGAHAGDTDASARLMRDVWREGTFAEYVRVPLENVHALDEGRLLGSPSPSAGLLAGSGTGLGYKVEDLVALIGLLVPFGGLDDIGLRPGERVIIAPATGWVGGWAVLVAVAMGAHVVAAGRNGAALANVKARVDRAYGPGRVDTVQLSGAEDEIEADTTALKAFGPVDCFFEISPPSAAKATFICAAIRALRREGRVSLMGGILQDIMMPVRYIMHNNIRVLGKWMYEPDAIKRLIGMVEKGVLKLGEAGGIEIASQWQLEEWEAAFQAAAENSTIGRMVIFDSFAS